MPSTSSMLMAVLKKRGERMIRLPPHLVCSERCCAYRAWCRASSSQSSSCAISAFHEIYAQQMGGTQRYCMNGTAKHAPQSSMERSCLPAGRRKQKQKAAV
eukprot:12287-Heterococcus_DN1.PRE.15